MTESTVEQLDRLIGEALDFLPKYTPHRGSFNSLPEAGFVGRNPSAWQREVMEVLDLSRVEALKPDTNDIMQLVGLVNVWTASSPTWTYTGLDSSERLLPASTLATVLGYALLEMVVRKLLPNEGEGRNSFDRLFGLFEKTAVYPELVANIRELKKSISYKTDGRNIDLYTRLKEGRDVLLHGRALRAAEGEGLLLAPLIDLILLHLMKQSVEAG